ncbi:energy transducer TonB [Flavobacterium cyclinae]|uniref:energy transducer TonB n=1 Tax=Flavobacterium cyclinae TaxID=2895947 RepID=UPI001E3249A7|nr:energy transducer TonB [Flavobacterium cyclinae]UGS20303.1 energy transducer TonB [Flavobacterium cyclinae]
MKKYFYIVVLLSLNCLSQVNSNENQEILSFNKVDVIPIFENCKNEKKDNQRDCVVNLINAHIEKNLKYPEEAKKVNLESKVFCTFIIDENGKVTVTEAKGKPTSFKKAFENEAIRVLNLLPKFIPGKHNDKLIKVQAQYTVEFKLKDDKIEIIDYENTPIVVMSDETIVGEPNYEDEVIPFQVVEQIPLFKECKMVELENQRECFQEQMKKHIETQLRYPEHAKQFKAQDRVITLFEINKLGYVTNIKVRSRLNDEFRILFESEAKRIIGTLPQFSPGLQRGKTVIVSYSIPINFKL